jgi:hypothetical protein
LLWNLFTHDSSVNLPKALSTRSLCTEQALKLDDDDDDDDDDDISFLPAGSV